MTTPPPNLDIKEQIQYHRRILATKDILDYWDRQKTIYKSPGVSIKEIDISSRVVLWPTNT